MAKEPRKIVTHQSAAEADANRKLTITAGPNGPGGAPDQYLVENPENPIASRTVQFQTLDMPGLTNEVLLALVADRLMGFQGGKFACEENGKALAHVDEALKLLKARTVRRVKDGVEGKMAETPKKK